MELFDNHRQLIPRWHTSRKLAKLQLPVGPVKPGKPMDPKTNDAFRLEEAWQIWKSSPCIASAVEVLAKLRLTENNEAEKIDPITSYLLDRKELLTDSIKRIISPALSPVDKADLYTTTDTEIYKIIAKLKILVKNESRDAFSWNDLAFYHATLGQHDSAERCMNIAFHASGKHPFIARAFSRLLIQKNDPEAAISVLRNTGLSRSHPTVASAEISIADQFGIGHPNVRNARRILNRSNSNQTALVSELAASIGTIEIASGALKSGKKYLTQALIEPTENTIAQLHWLAQQRKITFPEGFKAKKRSLEGEVIDSYANEQYHDCRDLLLQLHNFQPFSDKALADAGYISLVALDDPEFAIKLFYQFLNITQHSFIARNNAIVGLLEIGRVDEAANMMKGQRLLVRSERDRTHYSATLAMYLYKSGSQQEGRTLYELVIQGLRDSKDKSDLARALYYFGRAEFHHDKKYSEKLLTESLQLFNKTAGNLEFKSIFKRSRYSELPFLEEDTKALKR